MNRDTNCVNNDHPSFGPGTFLHHSCRRSEVNFLAEEKHRSRKYEDKEHDVTGRYFSC